MPKVSVVIPAFNAMTYLPKTVESALKQTFTDFEIVIVDDGSSDTIGQWANEVTDPRVKLISQENQGVSAARNTGIAHARGEYVAFIDADDLWEQTKLDKQVRCLDDNPAVGLVHTWMAIVDRHGKPTGRVMTSNAEGDVWQQLVERNSVACSSVMARRCCFAAVGVFACERELHPVEDWEMWIRIAKRYPFALVKEPLLKYRQHPNNGSKNWQAMERAFHLAIEKAFQSVPPELQHLKDRSYGYANLCLAWKPLQSVDRDYKRAIHFRTSALTHYPQLRYSSEYTRLSLAIAALQWFGPELYSRLLTLTYALRRRISNVEGQVNS